MLTVAATVAATITEPAAISISHTSSNVLCNSGNTGTVTLTVNGGTTPYTYLWSNGANTQNLAAATAGNYDVTVTDANLCTAAYNGNITITQPAVLSATATPTHNLFRNKYGFNKRWCNRWHTAIQLYMERWQYIAEPQCINCRPLRYNCN